MWMQERYAWSTKGTHLLSCTLESFLHASQLKWQRRELQDAGDSFARMIEPVQRLQHPMPSRELPETSSASFPKAERSIQHIHRDKGGRTSEVIRSADLATLPTLTSLPSLSSSLSSGTFTISHHISHSGSGQALVNQKVCQESIHLKKVRLNLGTYNIRGLKRFGRQSELSHLLEKHNLDIVGIQETKCSGNTLSTLAAGFLLNSSDNPFPEKEEHRGTGLIFRKTLAQALRKTYQGSSRWCGALFLANPVPLLILSVYAPTAAAEPDTKDTFYQDISEIIAENGGAMIVILGDFNASIITDPVYQDTLAQTFLEENTHWERIQKRFWTTERDS